MATDSIEKLIARVTALEDDAAILATLSRYAHAIDYGVIQGWADCFTEDGVFDVVEASGKRVHREAGHQELVSYLSTKQFPPDRYVKHVVTVPLIEKHGDVANAASYFMLLARNGSKAELRIFGRYRDTLVKLSGTWLIKERIATIEGGS